MKRIKILFLLLLPLFAFCQTTDRAIAEHYQIKKSDIAIFPKDDGELIGGIRFTPTKEEVEKAENALRGDLKTINQQLVNQDGTNNNPIIHKNLNKYKRQYFGYINEDGERILQINALWRKSEHSKNWLRNRVEVFDGGSHYWNVKFNLKTGELFDLSVNGNA